MNNELVLNKIDNKNSNKTVEQLKTIASDSLFYFAIFLCAVAFLNILPYLGGIFENLTFGINEVAVSTLGFINVFFLRIFNTILIKAN